jgi:gamma-hexachlorocyclohexane dehydrochlorinase
VLSDRAEIADVMAQYCHGLDKREFDTFLEIWHVDAAWEMGDLGVFAGKEAIGTCAQLLWSVWQETHHFTSSASSLRIHRAD